MGSGESVWPKRWAEGKGRAGQAVLGAFCDGGQMRKSGAELDASGTQVRGRGGRDDGEG